VQSSGEAAGAGTGSATDGDGDGMGARGRCCLLPARAADFVPPRRAPPQRRLRFRAGLKQSPDIL